MKKTYVLTIASIGLFVGFWLGYSVFASVHIKVVCRPSGRVLVDVTRNLLSDFVLSADVEGCEGVDLVVSKPALPAIFERQVEEGQEEPAEPSETNETEMGIGGPSDPSEIKEIAKDVFGSEDEPETYTKVPYLEIFDICTIRSGCMDEKGPYYITLNKDANYLNVSFYESTLNETRPLSDSIPILSVFVEDLATLPEELVDVEIYGILKNYFSLSYITENVIEGRAGGTQATKEIAIISLSVDKNIPSSDWSVIKFYLKTALDTYYVGDIFFSVI